MNDVEAIVKTTRAVAAYRVAAVAGVVALGLTGPGWMTGAAFVVCALVALRVW